MRDSVAGELRLRHYQHGAIEACRAHIRAGKRAPLIVAPTGSGKTCMGVEIARSHVARGGKVVWSAHRSELISQAADTLRRAGLAVGCRGLNASAPVQVESIQTIVARGSAPSGTLCILDEAHHYAAEQWKALPEVFAHAFIVGLTATPERGDGLGLGGVHDCIVVAAQIKDLVREGHLVPCGPEHIYAPRKARTGKTLELSPVDAYCKYAPGTSAVVFAPHVQAAHDFAAAFVARGIQAKVVTGTTASDERDETLYQFWKGALRVAVNVNVLTEGWDAPIAQTCILARKVGSAGAYLQMVGRVLRPYTDGKVRKTHANLLDLYGTNVEAFGPPDAEREYSLEGRAIKLRGVEGPGFCKVHGRPLPCDECEGPAELRTPGDAGGELDKWAAFREHHKPLDKRVAFLASLMRTAQSKGYKPGWVAQIYKSKMKHWPPTAIRELAEAQVRGEFAIGERDAE